MERYFIRAGWTSGTADGKAESYSEPLCPEELDADRIPFQDRFERSLLAMTRV
jgi:hypothetical protein